MNGGKQLGRLGLPAGVALALLLGPGALGHDAHARPHRPAARPRSAGGPRARPFRWLVRTEGRPPSVAEQNRAQGTRAWALRWRSARQAGRIMDYASAQDVLPGQRERIYASAPGARWIRAAIYRIGWYGGRGGRLVLISRRLPAIRQPPCHHDAWTGLTECRWHASLGFQVPSALTSGVYVVKLESNRGAQRDCLFVVESVRRTPMLAQIPTATYEAYNGWGGDSLYVDHRPGRGRQVGVTGSSQGVEVSYDRPYEGPTGAGEFFDRDVAMVRFLEREGYSVSYTTSPSVDLHSDRLSGRRVLLDIGHSEYWSARAARAFTRARDAGTSLAFFSSDTLTFRIRYAAATRWSSEAGEADHVVVAYKQYAGRDPERRTEPTGHFPHAGAQLTGTAYARCVTPRVRRPRSRDGQLLPHTNVYYAWMPSPRRRPRWLYRGTGFTRASRVRGIVGYEIDRTTPDTPRGTLVLGEGAARCIHQRDADESHARSGGRSDGGPRTEVAQSTLCAGRSGALVFSSGTMGWQLGLSPVPDASVDGPRRPDRRLVRLTENLLRRMLRGHA